MHNNTLLTMMLISELMCTTKRDRDITVLLPKKHHNWIMQWN